MSGLFDKKTEGATHRQSRTQKELQAKRKTRIISISVVSVLVLVFAGSLFVNSHFIRRTLPAVTIGGVKFSAAEFDYFYNTSYFEYSEWVNQQFADMPDWIDSMMPSRDLPHASQVRNEETGETWADYFTNSAFGQMSELVQYYNAAKAAGFTITEAEQESVDSQVTGLLTEGEYYAALYPQNYPNRESYLRAIYGSSMNEKLLRKILTFIMTALSYSESKIDEFAAKYSAADLEAFYLENRDDLDVFRYRVFLVSPETVAMEDYDSDEDYQAANDAALAAAKENARSIADSIETEEDFIEAARVYDEESYDDIRSTLIEHLGESVDESFSPWLREEPRENGDVTTIDQDYGAYVVFFVERDDNNYALTAMRQILFMRAAIDPEQYPEGVKDPDYISDFDFADEDVRARAFEVYQQFAIGGATEELLLELIDAGESDDNTEGGFYEGMARISYQYKVKSGYIMRVVPEIEDWLFNKDRKVDDSTLVYTEAYGYHLLYFMGWGERLRDLIASDRLCETDFAEWRESLSAVEPVKNWAFLFTHS